MDNDMVQFTITGVENVLELIALAHKDILEDDEFWHFFNEDEEGIFLRCSHFFANNLNAWLEDYGYTFTRGDYVEDSPVVNSFPWYFKRIFHLNSKMALAFYEEWFITDKDRPDDDPQKTMDLAKSGWVGAITERLAHCFLNNLQDYTTKYRLQSKLRFGDDNEWESYVLAELIIDRSVWTGMRKAYLDTVNRKEKGEHDTKQERRENIQT